MNWIRWLVGKPDSDYADWPFFDRPWLNGCIAGALLVVVTIALSYGLHIILP